MTPQTLVRFIGAIMTMVSIYKIGGFWWMLLAAGIVTWMPEWWLIKR